MHMDQLGLPFHSHRPKSEVLFKQGGSGDAVGGGGGGGGAGEDGAVIPFSSLPSLGQLKTASCLFPSKWPCF